MGVIDILLVIFGVLLNSYIFFYLIKSQRKIALKAKALEDSISFRSDTEKDSNNEKNKRQEIETFDRSETDFNEPFVAIQNQMMSLALTLTQEKSEAERLIQKTKIYVLGNKEKIVDDTHFKGWVFTVMRNIFIYNYRKICRKQFKENAEIDLYILDLIIESNPNSLEEAYKIEDIFKVVCKLDKEYRIPFLMHLSGYKYKEIAEELNLSLGTVKSRIFFVRQELQKTLKDLYKK